MGFIGYLDVLGKFDVIVEYFFTLAWFVPTFVDHILCARYYPSALRTLTHLILPTTTRSRFCLGKSIPIFTYKEVHKVT